MPFPMRLTLPLMALCSALAAPAMAGGAGRWDSASHLMAAGLPALAGLTTLAKGDTEGTRQLVLATGSALATAEVLKRTLQSTRPDGSDNMSFPSGHSTLAFAAASFMDRRYGEQLGPWRPALYGVAALTGVARVQADRHRWVDVAAGAALGYGMAHLWAEPLQGGQLSVAPMPGGLAVGWARGF